MHPMRARAVLTFIVFSAVHSFGDHVQNIRWRGSRAHETRDQFHDKTVRQAIKADASRFGSLCQPFQLGLNEILELLLPFVNLVVLHIYPPSRSPFPNGALSIVREKRAKWPAARTWGCLGRAAGLGYVKMGQGDFAITDCETTCDSPKVAECRTLFTATLLHSRNLGPKLLGDKLSASAGWKSKPLG